MNDELKAIAVEAGAPTLVKKKLFTLLHTKEKI